jgi:hypothetical protein
VVTDPLLPALNDLVHTSLAMTTVAETLRRVTQQLAASGALMAWEVVSPDAFGEGLPTNIRSCWIFVIRAGATTGAERHPNSHQRSFSLIGGGTFEVRGGSLWRSHPLESTGRASVEQRWVSIPPSTWHRLVVGTEPWGMLSFHMSASTSAATNSACIRIRTLRARRRPGVLAGCRH